MITGLLLLWCALATQLFGQGVTPLPNPQDLGLVLPAGAVARVTDQLPVLLRNERKPQQQLVAQTYVEIGDRYVVKLPAGELRSVLKAETTVTERPFRAATKEEMEAELLEQFKGFRAFSTEHYLCIHNTSDGFCERKARILEAIHPLLILFCEQQGLSPAPQSTPLVVVMFKTRDEFQEFRRMPEQALAYYNSVSNRIYLYEHSKLEDVAPLIAIMQSTSTIAHEGVHQILHNIGVQKRLASWPMWISEGLPEYFSGASLSSTSQAGVAAPNQLRMHDLFQHLASRPASGDGSLVREVVSAQSLSSTQYAVAWALTHYLATQRTKDFSEYLQRLSRIPPLAVTDHSVTQFATHFGNDFAEIEKEVLAHARSLPYTDPLASQPHYMVIAYSLRGTMAIVTSSPEQFKKARAELLKKIPPSEHQYARFKTRTFPNKLYAEKALRVLTRGR
jgi:hypothetical protein